MFVLFVDRESRSMNFPAPAPFSMSWGGGGGYPDDPLNR